MKPFEWIALIGAFAWLPHVVIFLKDIFSKPEIRIIIGKTAELGFTTLGAILNLRIAFAVKNKDIVISGIKLRLKHESGEEKVFSWQGIVQNMLQMKSPEGGLIPFEKELTVLAIKLAPKEIEERFIRFQDQAYHTNKEVYEMKSAKKLIYMQESGNPDFDAFLNSEEMRDLYSFIKQSFNWKSGNYSVIFEIESPEKFILKDNEYKFELTSIDVEHIEKNKGIIERSYEYEVKPKKDEEVRQDLVWAWRNPVLTKTT